MTAINFARKGFLFTCFAFFAGCTEPHPDGGACLWGCDEPEPTPECVATVDVETPAECGNGVDEDCNGSDLACQVEPQNCDADNDNHGRIGCDDGTEIPADDCNDADGSVHPGAPEVCDGPDKNCDGIVVDCPEPTDCDVDGDGVDGSFGVYCGGNDCNDNDATIRPGATDVCGDGIDQDCSGADLECPPELIELGGNDIDDDLDGYADEGIAPLRKPNGDVVGYLTISFPVGGSPGLRAQPCIYGSVASPADPDSVQGLGRCMPGGFDAEGATRIPRGGAGVSLASAWPDASVHQAIDCEAARQGITGAPGSTDMVLRLLSPNGVQSSTMTVVYNTPGSCGL